MDRHIILLVSKPVNFPARQPINQSTRQLVNQSTSQLVNQSTNQPIMQPIKRICLWSGPRNMSTAFMYSWAQRSDTVVVDEPLYGYYLEKTGIVHPGREEVMASMDCDRDRVVAQMITGTYDGPLVFFKHMAHHMVEVDYEMMAPLHNLFFIRNPRQVLTSYAEVITNPVSEDVGIEKQYELYRYALERGYKVWVLDSGQLLQNPAEVLKKLCAAMEIPFYECMLHWQAGARPEDGIWAKYWYTNVHRSTRFAPQKEDERALPAHLEPLCRQLQPVYDKLLEVSIKV
jgi:hypothetical protein